MDEWIVKIFNKECCDGRIIGHKIYKYAAVGSTNDIAFMHGIKGEKEGAVFTSREQASGRGRLQRQWLSEKDKGLYFSVILRPDILAKDAHKMTLISALSCVKALRQESGIEFLIKWPNDIVVNDKKIGGILTEMEAEVQKVRFIVVGMGVNTNYKQKELPIKEAVSLAMILQKKIDNQTLLTAILGQLDSYYFLFKKSGFEPIIKEARQYSNLFGRQVKIEVIEKNGQKKWPIEGMVVDFDDNGGLVIRQPNGTRAHIMAGDVKLVRA